MKSIITAMILLMSISLANAQTLERQVIGSAGIAVQSLNAGLSSTVGEVVTASAVSNNVQLNQGFQQSGTEGMISVFESPRPELWLHVFPNPTADVLKISSNLFQDGITELAYSVYDLQGKVVLQGNIFSDQDEISVLKLAASSYTLSLIGANGKYSYHSRFVKL